MIPRLRISLPRNAGTRPTFPEPSGGNIPHKSADGLQIQQYQPDNMHIAEETADSTRPTRYLPKTDRLAEPNQPYLVPSAGCGTDFYSVTELL
jgi:hypothetical protein